jgi:8-oxo-dGTP pyrophosphatase MutT (NUDIX family)
VASLRITAADVRGAVAGQAQPLETGPIDVSAARPAGVAVLIALSPEPLMYLVLRGSHLADHAGEIAFPGGKPDPGDASLQATAAREALEEVGVEERDIEWVGTLSPVPVITGRYMIHAFVGLLAEGVVPRVASGEIVKVLSLPLAPYIAGDLLVRAVEVEWHGHRMLAPHFPIDAHILYGATAYITWELLLRLAAAMGRELSPPAMESTAPWAKRYR